MTVTEVLKERGQRKKMAQGKIRSEEENRREGRGEKKERRRGEREHI